MPESFRKAGGLTLQYEFLLEFVIECGQTMKSVIPELVF